ncbi:MAG TPA: TIGR00282 family metallophosphoesterase [bacterium]|nr:TIGR00282 family metallophosphoesterase [bacterium]
MVIKFLLIGDIVAKMGRDTVDEVLPKLKRQYQIDYIIANGENLAHGDGVNVATISEMYESGVDFLTTGDHIFKNASDLNNVFFGKYNIIRPANYPDGVIGDGYKIVRIKNYKILIINLLGRVFMKNNPDCPFRKFDQIYNENKRKKIDCIIVDIHAEATSEKKTFFEYVKDRANIVFGTHTHVGTADLDINNGHFYITDIGMVGAKNSSLGVDFKNIIENFLYQIPVKHEFPETGTAIFNSVLVEYDISNKIVISAKRLDRIIEI